MALLTDAETAQVLELLYPNWGMRLVAVVVHSPCDGGVKLVVVHLVYHNLVSDAH